MATTLQKYELEQTLMKYGNIIRSVDNGRWKRITIAPYGRGANARYSSSNKVEYLAMRKVEQHLFHDLQYQVRLIEDES